MSGKNFSMSWNVKKQQFKANVRMPDGSGWKTKWLPKSFGETQEIQAEAWLIDWVGTFQKTWVAPENAKPNGKVTLAEIAPRWLQLRTKQLGTRIKTLKVCTIAVNCFILDNPKHPHKRIAHLDIETELAKVAVIREWIESIPGKPWTRLRWISVLSTLISDAIAEGWLSEDFINPFRKEAVKRQVREINSLGKRMHKIKSLPIKAVNKMLSSKLVPDPRKVFYAIASHGLRPSEILGLRWSDFVDGKTPYLIVQRQLIKRGPKPVLVYEELLEAGATKAEIMQKRNAVVSDPKTSNSRRVVPLHPEAAKALRWFWTSGWFSVSGRAPQSDDPIFSRGKKMLGAGERPTDFGIHSQTLRYRLRLDLDKVGEPTSYTIRALRRTFSTQLRVAGAHQENREAMMGHSPNTVAAEHYEGLNPNRLARETDIDPEERVQMVKQLPDWAKDVVKLGLAPIRLGSKATKSATKIAPTALNSAAE